MNLSIAPVLSLLKLSARVPSSVRTGADDFAALLGSLHVDEPVLSAAAVIKKDSATTAPALKKDKEDDRKPGAEPKAEEETILAALPFIEMPTSPKQEPLPIVLSLPLPATIPADVQAASSPQVSPEREVQTLQPAISNFSISLKAAPVKTKTSTAVQPEPLAVLQLPLKETPKDKPRSEIAFEAKLTQSQTKPSAPTEAESQTKSPTASQPTAPTLRPGPRDEAKAPDKPASPPEVAAPAPASRPAAPSHNAEPALKVLETPAITVPAPHIERAASPASRTEVPSSASPGVADLPDLPAPRTEPARDISFRIASMQNEAVDVKLVDRAGQIHVAVRSADPVLTQSLQANVSDLAGKLEKAGFQTETTIPNRTEPVHQPQQNPAFQNFQQDRRAPQQEMQLRKKRNSAPAATFTLNPPQENA